MLELYHWEPNTSALKVLICLHEKGLEFESHYVDLLNFEQHRAEFLALNQEGQVPVLVHDDKVLTESQFINEYLDEVYPVPALTPTSAENLWRMRVWGKLAGEMLAPAVSTLGCHAHLSPSLKIRDIQQNLDRIPVMERQNRWRMAAQDDYGQDLLEDSQRKIKLAVQKLEDRLSKHAWLAGDNFSLADIEGFAWTNSLENLTPELVNTSTCSGVIDWLNRIRERPGVIAALAHAKSSSPQRCFVPGPEHSRWG